MDSAHRASVRIKDKLISYDDEFPEDFDDSNDYDLDEGTQYSSLFTLHLLLVAAIYADLNPYELSALEMGALELRRGHCAAGALDPFWFEPCSDQDTIFLRELPLMVGR